jgi:ArsR family transcriptional regulator
MNIEIFGYSAFHNPFDSSFSAGCGSRNRLDSGQTEDRYLMDRSQIERVSKALADETRLRIFEAISDTGHMNCGEIVSLRGVTPATVSHHLKVLSEAGLIACRREGQFVYSEAVPETVEEYTRALAKIAKIRKSARRR